MSSANSTTSSAFFAEARNRESNNSSFDQCNVVDNHAQQAAANSLAGDAVLSFEDASASSRPIRRKRSPIMLGEEQVLPKPKRARVSVPKSSSRPAKKARKTRSVAPVEGAVLQDVFPDPPAQGPLEPIVMNALVPLEDAAGAHLADAAPNDDDDYTYGSDFENELPPRQPERRAFGIPSDERWLIGPDDGVIGHLAPQEFKLFFWIRLRGATGAFEEAEQRWHRHDDEQ